MRQTLLRSVSIVLVAVGAAFVVAAHSARSESARINFDAVRMTKALSHG